MTTVVKVGGSLYDLPDLGPRLRDWLGTLKAEAVLIVPGGGATAEVIRCLDRTHALGEMTSHRLALQAMTVNAWLLSALLGDVPVLSSGWNRVDGIALLDAAAFLKQDSGPDRLPASWDATSDAVAARAALVLQAEELILLKSVDVPSEMSWQAAAQAGFVDALFPGLAARIKRVRAVNFRSWPPAAD
jgi:aspartokinase-like uncharacterized kinase